MEWGEAIINAITECRVLVLIFSSRADASAQVRREVERAISKGKIIVPFRIENVLPSGAMEYAISTTHWLDALTPPLEKHLAELCESVQRLTGDIPPKTVNEKPEPTPAHAGQSGWRWWMLVAAAAIVIAAFGSWAFANRQRAAAISATRTVVAPPSPPAPMIKLNPIDNLKYVWIPPGRFSMGCSPGDRECLDDEEPAHDVTIAKGFWMGQTEVTQEAYQKVIRRNPSRLKGTDLPVENVNWRQAQDYCKSIGGRLPTEAEWEYAARGGTPRGRYGPLAEIAWYQENGGQKPHPVGQKQPNAYLLYDMLGNVQELTGDWYKEYSSEPHADASGPADGKFRVVRGGDAWDGAATVRATDRERTALYMDGEDTGFRCVRELFP
jgi:formylglycine-generating enzyme required for sulfatase activity